MSDEKLPDYVSFAISEYGHAEYSDGTVDHTKKCSGAKRYRVDLEAAITQYAAELRKELAEVKSDYENVLQHLRALLKEHGTL